MKINSAYNYNISNKKIFRTDKNWKLTDSLKERIINLAKEDAKENVYMGKKFLSLRKSEVSKVSPNRSALMGKINGALGSPEDMKKIEEADKRLICMLFGKPYKAEFQSKGFGSAVHVYDENNDEILTYTQGVGWHQKESKAENEVHQVLKSVYYEAYHNERANIKSQYIGENKLNLKA